MPLPGTGRGEDMEVGTTPAPAEKSNSGERGYSGGLANQSGPITTVARPRNFANSGGLVFEKVHRVLAYGLASVNLGHPLNTDAASTVDMRLMTTSLMEIPWDKPFFYLSPGELEALPLGSYVKSVHVTVVQRNPRVAFETAASTASLATLNQNKFGVKAMGLNTKQGLRVTNRRYTAYKPDEPMIPTETEVSKYDDIDQVMYGVDQSTVTFNTVIPSTCFMVPITMPNYLTCWNAGFTLNQTANHLKTGWYSLAEHVTQFDMNSTTGTEIMNASYFPSYAPLKAQTPYAEYLRGQLGPVDITGQTGINFNVFSYTEGDVTKQVSKITLNNVIADIGAIPSETYDISDTDRDTFDQVGGRYTNIEKGQLLKNIDRGDHPKCVQPSLHVGISPVPKLTTTSNIIDVNSWTDVQSYYEIKAVMHIGYNFPHHNTHQNTFNVESNDIKMGVSENLNNEYPIRFGKNPQFP